MQLNEAKFGIACAITAALLWALCSILVLALPSLMLSVTGSMVHMQLQDMEWHLNLAGALVGLLAWVIAAGFSGWSLASVYNRLMN